MPESTPSPTQAPKRKAERLSSAGDIYKDSKRQRVIDAPSDTISNWLSGIPVKRRYSDSSLRCSMSTRNDGSTHLPSPQSLQHVAPPSPLQLMPPPPPRSVPDDLQSVSLPQSQMSQIPSSAAAKERVKDPSYREDLENHLIFIRAWDRLMPSSLRDYVDEILRTERGSPELHATELARLEVKFAKLESSEEADIRATIQQSCLFPQPEDYQSPYGESSICRVNDLIFDKTALPNTPAPAFRRVVKPVPDWCLGYSKRVYGKPGSVLQAVVAHPRIRPFSHPTSGGMYWPWLSVEFKAPSRGGTSWVAENQCAGTGAHSVNSIESLLTWVGGVRPGNMTDSMAFSFVVIPRGATLWVHWREIQEDGDLYYVSSRIRNYQFCQKGEFNEFRKHTRNIVDWGLNTRLQTISDALGKLSPILAQWDLADAANKKRRRRSSVAQSDNDDASSPSLF